MVLFVTPREITNTTILGGNVDPDKYTFCIEGVQISVIEPLLGSELYDVIVAGATNGDLTGKYLELYTDFVKPITKNEALAEYIEIASLMINNGGIFKHAPESKEIPSRSEVEGLSEKYHNLGQMYVGRFEKWIQNNRLSEYKTYQEDVNAIDVKTTSGWWL